MMTTLPALAAVKAAAEGATSITAEITPTENPISAIAEVELEIERLRGLLKPACQTCGRHPDLEHGGLVSCEECYTTLEREIAELLQQRDYWRDLCDAAADWIELHPMNQYQKPDKKEDLVSKLRGEYRSLRLRETLCKTPPIS